MALLVSDWSARGQFVKLVVTEIIRGQPEMCQNKNDTSGSVDIWAICSWSVCEACCHWKCVTTRMLSLALLVSKLSLLGQLVKLVVSELVRGQSESVSQQEWQLWLCWFLSYLPVVSLWSLWSVKLFVAGQKVCHHKNDNSGSVSFWVTCLWNCSWSVRKYVTTRMTTLALLVFELFARG